MGRTASSRHLPIGRCPFRYPEPSRPSQPWKFPSSRSPRSGQQRPGPSRLGGSRPSLDIIRRRHHGVLSINTSSRLLRRSMRSSAKASSRLSSNYSRAAVPAREIAMSPGVIRPASEAKQTLGKRVIRAAFDPGCVKTQALNLRVEFPSRFRRCGNQSYW